MKTYRKKMIYKSHKGNSLRKEKAIVSEFMVLLSAHATNAQREWKGLNDSLL